MRHILFGSDLTKINVAVLIKATALNANKIKDYYINPTNVPHEQFIAFDLAYDKKKVSAACAKAYIVSLLPEIAKLKIKTLLCCDGDYFTYLTGMKKPSAHYGYSYPCQAKGFEDIQVILAPNYQGIVYNPDVQSKIDVAVETLVNQLGGSYVDPGLDIIKFAAYPATINDSKDWFKHLLTLPELTCDLEGLSLNFWECGISTIGFSWNEHEGTVFTVDRGPYGKVIRSMLKEFFQMYKGKLVYHNANFDMKVLVYTLWMKNLADYEGMLKGIDILTTNFDDTKLITYLATNNAVKNVLGLKPNTAEFTGNYAEDITDTSKIPLPELLVYNLKDCLATWWLKKKNYCLMIADQQEQLYREHFLPTVKSLMQMELCGMPINPKKVLTAEKKLQGILDECTRFFENSVLIKEFHYQEQEKLAAKLTAKAKKKVYDVNDPIVQRFVFKPSSGTQVEKLLYDYLGFEVVDLTKGKKPSTGGKTLKKLLNHTTNKAYIELIEFLRKRADASIILTTFIKAFKNAQQLPDGSWRLYGNFNLGGTQSLRLSSSNPNLTNIPSGSTFAELIKECFEPIKGWIFGGSDFDSLEDKVNALITKDPNKLKVYTDLYDGHCLRALAYFGNKMKGIDPSDVTSVNSIKTVYKVLRQLSKAPTFALTYGGTFITLMKNCGFSKAQAQAIEAKYHELYAVADQWVADLVEKAKDIGYIPLAFGGRIRTPILAKTIGKGRVVPFHAQAEARSAGNAGTQSYCFLTIRAYNEFMERVWKSPYRYKILPAATVHDSLYFMWRETAAITKWINDNLIDCMKWQDLPELAHPTITMSSELDIFWPNWANDIGVPPDISEDEIRNVCKAGAQKYKDKLKEAA
jgi:DNA polymerase-1